MAMVERELRDVGGPGGRELADDRLEPDAAGPYAGVPLRCGRGRGGSRHGEVRCEECHLSGERLRA
eukprot:11969863-Alexandrium_andersonii.AAC.1